MKNLLLLFCISFFACTPSQKNKSKQSINTGESIEKAISIPKDFQPKFESIQIEDISFTYKGKQVKRFQNKIILSEGLSKEEILNNLRACAINIYKQHTPKAISILAYKDKKEVNGAFTIAKYEFCPLGDWNEAYRDISLFLYKENYNIIENDLKPKKKVFQIGDEVLLFRKEKWDVKQQKFISANTTPISKDSRNFTEENIIKEIKNDTPALIVDIYEETLTGGSIWRVLKITTKNKPTITGWIYDNDAKLKP